MEGPSLNLSVFYCTYITFKSHSLGSCNLCLVIVNLGAMSECTFVHVAWRAVFVITERQYMGVTWDTPGEHCTVGKLHCRNLLCRKCTLPTNKSAQTTVKLALDKQNPTPPRPWTFVLACWVWPNNHQNGITLTTPIAISISMLCHFGDC